MSSGAIDRLRGVLARSERIAVALSGGLDSSVLAAFAAEILGARNCLALTARAPYMVARELAAARALCEKSGVELVDIDLSDAFSLISGNPPDRCFVCKTRIFSALKTAAAERGIGRLCDGTNADDLSDYRPGMAALKNLGVESPFLEAGLGKAEIRALAESMGLECAREEASACLMTRFETGANVGPELLRRVERAEEILRAAGFPGARARAHCAGELLRIELPERFLSRLSAGSLSPLALELKALGFKFVSLDLLGYRRGNMNGV